MRCCVTGCKNDSRRISKSQGITFHVFPNEPSLRSAWLKSLGKEKWEPKERSAVCSEHFLSEDLYETRNGLRKVKVGAVPLILQDSHECVYGDIQTLKVCRICLIPCYGKMLSLRLSNLKQAYEDLTGITLELEDKLPQKLCPECATRLLSHDRFRTRSLRANSIMLEILKKQCYLSEENLATVNRDNNDLSSPLKAKHYAPDHYDMNIEYDEDTYESKPIQLNVEVEIKNESENDMFIDEDVRRGEGSENVKRGERSENVRRGEGSEDVRRSEGSDDARQSEGSEDDDVDEDFNDSDTDCTSDDSLPLERARTKRKLKKNEDVTIKKNQVKKPPEKPKIDRRRKPFLDNDPNEILFTITELTVQEQVAEIEKRQESSNYKNAVYRCTECYKGYLDEDAYNSHMNRHTIQCGQHKCSICKTHFKNQHALRKHITAHHTQRFSCNQCSYTTTHRQTARLHERWHKGTKYQCPHCQDEFVKFTTYMGHIRIKHPSDFVCELCGFSFVSAKGIELHKKLKHMLDDGLVPEDGPYCELCNVRFISAEAHKQHLNVSGRHIKPDAARGRKANQSKRNKGRQEKERKLREKRERDKMENAERNGEVYPKQWRKVEGPLPCEQCGLQLEDSRAYHSHFRRMHPDKNRTSYPSMKSPCMCEVCGRIFQSYSLLKDHRWVHTGERPFKCDLCEKSFRMKQRLVSHRRVHADARAHYPCDLCGKNFSTQSNRQRHMFIHTGLKPFKCEMCGKGFKHASEKRTHVTYVHLKKPWPKRSRSKRRTDSRQCSMLPNTSEPTTNANDNLNTNEIDTQQPIWPTCDTRHIPIDINTIIEDRHMYYNLRM